VVFSTTGRGARRAHVWLDEVPQWAAVDSARFVDGYWRLSGGARRPGPSRMAAWGFHVALGGKSSTGLLGARFEPHDHPYLCVRVAATSTTSGPAPTELGLTGVALPHEYAGAVLVGALQEPHRVGPGTLTFTSAAVHDVDSSWDAFRLLAIGVVRLLTITSGALPPDLLPYFGGTKPTGPGSH
jgi:hypothetical protein